MDGSTSIELSKFGEHLCIEEVGQDGQLEESDSELCQVFAEHDRSLREQVLNLTQSVLGLPFEKLLRPQERHHFVGVVFFVNLHCELKGYHVRILIDLTVKERVDEDLALFGPVL